MHSNPVSASTQVHVNEGSIVRSRATYYGEGEGRTFVSAHVSLGRSEGASQYDISFLVTDPQAARDLAANLVKLAAALEVHASDLGKRQQPAE